MRFLTKVAAATTLALGGGAGAVWYSQRGTAAVREVKQLTAKDFNGLQNAAMLKAALTPSHLPWTYHANKDRYANLHAVATEQSTSASPSLSSPDAAATGRSYSVAPADVKLVFYRLLGCPYCAKVEAVLQYYDVPYAEVWIDPISGRGLPDRRYQLAPQLFSTPLQATPASESPQPPAVPDAAAATAAATTRDGVYLVDSAEIVAQLAVPLKFTADLANPRVSATRDWITNHFHGASFAITNNSVRDAYATYTYVTPSSYQNIFSHVIGSVALAALSRFKIQPRLIAKVEKAGEESGGNGDGVVRGDSNGVWMLTDEWRTFLASTMHSASAEEWLRAELQTFLQRRPDGKLFHGGSQPDLADVEMYGVSRVVSQHPRLGTIVHEGPFGEWQFAMREKLKANSGGVYA